MRLNVWLLAGLCVSAPVVAAPPMPMQGTATVAFPPDDDASAQIVEALVAARRQILVQAYIMSHRAIAEALVGARRRGLDVRVIADAEQAGKVETSQLGWLAVHDVGVYLDGQHAAAHNKVMVIDADLPEATIVTGSFNFTRSAQSRNAENLLILRGNPGLAERYAADWHRHRAHSPAMRK